MAERRAFGNRVVVITGGGGGIGAALGRAFVAEGARVALLDRDAAALGEAVAGLPKGRAMGIELDVCDEEACEAAMDRVCAAWGGVDVLINNAGISHRSLFADTKASVVRRVMEVNFFGSVNCTAAALSSITTRKGLIIAISSVAGFAPLIGRTGYCASKHALHGFYDSLRTELRGTGAEVMMVCPSFIATKIETRALSGSGEAVGDGPRAKAGAVMQPDELAAEIVAGAARGDRLVTPSAISRSSFWLSRLAPKLYETLMLRSQRDEFPQAP
ncbi:MAG: short chain dehydrogenase [Deltaproteobacteria bacterium]|nr:MAG: short chain dehydrogenase [Deltaproteobacteria bacterium]